MVPPVTAFLREILLNYNPKFIWDIFLAITQGEETVSVFHLPFTFLEKDFPAELSCQWNIANILESRDCNHHIPYSERK
jgi:hypothetical protein